MNMYTGHFESLTLEILVFIKAPLIALAVRIDLFIFVCVNS